jgi:membrane-bound lytic murein transglycosylase D
LAERALSRSTVQWSAARGPNLCGLLLSCLLVFAGLRFSTSVLRLRRSAAQAWVLRRRGAVCISLSDQASVPFSFWWPGRAQVIIPSSLVHQPEQLRIAIQHELQHHRQADTRWVYVLWVLRQLGFFNPAVLLWSHWLSELQEFACDEALIVSKNVEPQAYTRCLVEVALKACTIPPLPVCATGLLFRGQDRFLTRRIEKMQKPMQKTKRGLTARLLLVGGVMISLTAYASRGRLTDRQISMAQAQEMARTVPASGFPVVVNASVLKWLNYYLGSNDGRQSLRAALQRMTEYRPVIQDKIASYGLPTELLAVPLVESGYKNLPESHRAGVGAGLWMFIPSTARKYGLRVDQQVDERLSVLAETDAAMRYLMANKQQFGDWLLALLAYNAGEGSVADGIARTGSHDVWALIRSGTENDKDYVARVLAGVLILNNPHVLD